MRNRSSPSNSPESGSKCHAPNSAASSAARRRSSLSSSAAWAALASVMSRMYPVNIAGPPVVIGVIASSIGNSPPSRRTAVISIRLFSTGPSPVLR